MRGVVVYAKQRTGTNFLRSTLSASTTLVDLGEIFHTNTLSDPGNFFTYCNNNQISRDFIREKNWIINVMEDYFDYVEKTFPIPLFDMKYNSVFAFSPSWISPVEIPIFLEIARRRGYFIVHLKRNDRIANAVSLLMADNTGIYHVDRDTSLPDACLVSTYIAPGIVLDMVTQYDHEYRLAFMHLRGYHHKSTLVYEDLCRWDDKKMVEYIRDVVCEDCDAEFINLGLSRTRKIIPDWRNIIQNAEEIEELISRSDTKSSNPAW
jgi:LPS sulfotransferase NodH